MEKTMAEGIQKPVCGRDPAHETGTFLSKEQFESVLALLSDLAVKLRISAVFLAEGTGRILALKKAAGFSGNAVVISTLAAAGFSATTEMASQLGEKEPFRMVLHEGRTQSVFVCSVCLDTILVVVFEPQVALGMIRLFTKRTIEEMRPILMRKPAEPLSLDRVFGGDFGTLLDEELDRSFKEHT
jgi:predicted regulator of Ras-like GTPase activity (Roadblock/LC7/MglB family)